MHLSYRGIAPALVDVLAGRVPLFLSTATSIKAHMEAGSLRPIAVLAQERLGFIPQTLTSAEQGFPDYRIQIHTGLGTTVGTPPAVVERLRRAQERVVASEPYKKLFDGPEGLAEFIDGPEWGVRLQKAYDDALQITKDVGLNLE
jgi:tripartite-type tricarboxylate transporter receptor subunit TctC